MSAVRCRCRPRSAERRGRWPRGRRTGVPSRVRVRSREQWSADRRRCRGAPRGTQRRGCRRWSWPRCRPGLRRGSGRGREPRDRRGSWGGAWSRCESWRPARGRGRPRRSARRGRRLRPRRERRRCRRLTRPVARWGRRGRRQHRQRVDVRVPAARFAHAEVQVWLDGGARAARADRTQALAGRHVRAGSDRERGEVQVRGVEAVGGPHAHGQARRARRAREQHIPACGRHHRRAHRRRNVDPAVLPSGIRVVAVSVLRDDIAPHRPCPRRVSRRSEDEKDAEAEQESAHRASVRAPAGGAGRAVAGLLRFVTPKSGPGTARLRCRRSTRQPRWRPCAGAHRLRRAGAGHRPRRGPPRPRRAG